MKALARTSTMNLLIVLAIIAIAYFVWKSKQVGVQVPQLTAGQYQNTKTWHITYDKNGMPSEITKHVDARIT